MLRLIRDSDDHLAWRTLVQQTTGVGPTAIRALEALARERGERFSTALETVESHPSALPRYGTKLCTARQAVLDALASAQQPVGGEAPDALLIAGSLADSVVLDPEVRVRILEYLESVAVGDDGVCLELDDLLRAIESPAVDLEQDRQLDAVNILTMHQAKGLTASAVIVAACEDEILPDGRTKSGELDDERRLLYVSLSRAKHHLVITYVDQRDGAQSHSGSIRGERLGSSPGSLRDGPYVPASLATYLAANPPTRG